MVPTGQSASRRRKGGGSAPNRQNRRFARLSCPGRPSCCNHDVSTSFEDDVAAKLNAESRRAGRPFKEIVNETLRSRPPASPQGCGPRPWRSEAYHPRAEQPEKSSLARSDALRKNGDGCLFPTTGRPEQTMNNFLAKAALCGRLVFGVRGWSGLGMSASGQNGSRACPTGIGWGEGALRSSRNEGRTKRRGDEATDFGA
jgi:hypothetical protein